MTTNTKESWDDVTCQLATPELEYTLDGISVSEHLLNYLSLSQSERFWVGYYKEFSNVQYLGKHFLTINHTLILVKRERRCD